MTQDLINRIFNISSSSDFEEVCIEVFRFQYEKVSVYRQFCDLLKVDSKEIKSVEQIPFLPIQFFKSHKVLAEGSQVEIIFTSSGTTGQITSKHYVPDSEIYKRAFFSIFEQFYGAVSDYVFLALLPSYLEREGSSLIYMAQELISASGHPESGFYLYNMDELANMLQNLENQNRKVILIGVSYALLDLIEKRKFKLKNTIVMETGGMKGKRREMVKEELHAALKEGFGTDKIHSEYGMTELLSQAYSKGDGIYETPPWMKILTRDPEDALTLLKGKTGGINVIDLANIYSCSFIATQDLGVVKEDGTFEIKGRFDNSDIRGCNLMVI